MARQTFSVPWWAQLTVIAGALITVAVLGVMFNAADKAGFEGNRAVPMAVTAVVATAVGALIWTSWQASVALWARLAVVVTAVQLGLALAIWGAWLMLAPKVENAPVSFPLLHDVPAPWVAMALALLVVVFASTAGRRRAGAPRWLHVVVVFALAYLLLLAYWVPLVATQVPETNMWIVDVRPWIGDYVALVLVPPAVIALGFALVVERRPVWLVRHESRATLACRVLVSFALIGALNARAEATPGAHFMYGNFVHVIFSVAAFALVALAALAWSHARAMAAGKNDRARPAPWAQEGVVVVEPEAANVVGQVVYHGVLGGLRTTVGSFVLRTAAGDLPVPSGARLDAPLPLATTAARRGEHLPVLSAGQKVVVTGFVTPDERGPFRGSTLPVPGPAGLVVSVPRAPDETATRDILLLVWRPCAVFLIVAALAALPGVFAGHAPYKPPTDLDEIVNSGKV